MSPEAEAIVAGVVAREAEWDEVETDPYMVGSEAYYAHHWGAHPLDDDEEWQR